MFEKIAVLGVGAIGSIIGGYLSRAGRDVTLIDTWGAHVEAMRERGLRVTAVDESFTTPVRAVHLGELSALKENFDLVFLCVKSYDTVWASHLLKPHLKAGGVVVSAQNSINDDVIASIVGYSSVLGCVVTLGAGIYEPAHVQRTSVPNRLAFTVGELSGMKTGRVESLAGLMSDAGPSKVTTNLWGERWAKLATNCMSNSVAALTGLGSADIRLTPGVVDQYVRIGAEVVEVGTALGVEIEPINGIPARMYPEAVSNGEAMEEVKARLAEGAHQLGEGRPSMAQDVLTRIHRRRASGQCPEAARGCSCESGIMVLKQQSRPQNKEHPIDASTQPSRPHPYRLRRPPPGGQCWAAPPGDPSPAPGPA